MTSHYWHSAVIIHARQLIAGGVIARQVSPSSPALPMAFCIGNPFRQAKALIPNNEIVKTRQQQAESLQYQLGNDVNWTSLDWQHQQ